MSPLVAIIVFVVITVLPLLTLVLFILPNRHPNSRKLKFRLILSGSTLFFGLLLVFFARAEIVKIEQNLTDDISPWVGALILYCVLMAVSTFILMFTSRIFRIVFFITCIVFVLTLNPVTFFLALILIPLAISICYIIQFVIWCVTALALLPQAIATQCVWLGTVLVFLTKILAVFIRKVNVNVTPPAIEEKSQQNNMPRQPQPQHRSEPEKTKVETKRESIRVLVLKGDKNTLPIEPLDAQQIYSVTSLDYARLCREGFAVDSRQYQIATRRPDGHGTWRLIPLAEANNKVLLDDNVCTGSTSLQAGQVISLMEPSGSGAHCSVTVSFEARIRVTRKK